MDAASPRHGNHVQCHCHSCRSAEIFLGQTDPKGDGVHIYQTSPDRITLLQGGDQISCFSFNANGLLRWYAPCCRAPLFNTTRRAFLPFVGIAVSCLSDPKAIGPARWQVFLPGPGGKQTHKGAVGGTVRTIGFMLGAWMSGRARQTPFFGKDGKPVVAAKILGKDEKRHLPLRG